MEKEAITEEPACHAFQEVGPTSVHGLKTRPKPRSAVSASYSARASLRGHKLNAVYLYPSRAEQPGKRPCQNCLHLGPPCFRVLPASGDDDDEELPPSARRWMSPPPKVGAVSAAPPYFVCLVFRRRRAQGKQLVCRLARSFCAGRRRRQDAAPNGRRRRRGLGGARACSSISALFVTDHDACTVPRASERRESGTLSCNMASPTPLPSAHRVLPRPWAWLECPLPPRVTAPGGPCRHHISPLHACGAATPPLSGLAGTDAPILFSSTFGLDT